MERVNYAEIVHRCFRCGYCKYPSDYSELNCPSYAKYRFETYFSGGRMWLIRAWVNGDLEWSNHLGEIIYSCSTCKNCVESCVFKFSDQIVDVLMAARSDMVERSLVPSKVIEFFNNIAKVGNPWGENPRKRTEWAEGKYYRGNEYLLFAGCVASYDTRARKALKALMELLEIGDVDFGVMEDERCEGNEVLVMGEFGLFEELAGHNIRKFREYGVGRILTPDPHAYNAFRNYYPRLGGEFEVIHHSQLILALMMNGNLKPSGLDGKATYHDPCFLGRWNGIYSEPRRILEMIPGLRFVEMRRNRNNAFCCGGGSGNFYTDYLGGRNSPARIRVIEASEIADILVTSCPACLMMLEDAKKSEGLDIEIKDLAEVVLECLKS